VKPRAARPADPAGELFASLDPLERDALTIVVYSFGGPVARTLAEEMLAILHGRRGRLAEPFERLVARGLLSATPAHHYTLRPEKEAAALGAVARWLFRDGVLRPEAPPAQVEDPARAVADFARLLGALSLGVQVTLKGLVFKPAQKRLRTAFDAARAGLAPGADEEAVWEGYEEPLGLFLALAIRLGLVDAARDGWRTAPDAKRWLAMHAAAQWRSLCRAWADLAGSLAEGRLHDVFHLADGPLWLDVRVLGERLQRYLPTFIPVGRVLMPVFVRPGFALGALEVAQDGQHALIRLTAAAAAALRGEPVPLPDMDERVVIQPDFEVLAPPRTPPSVLWDLERGAERLRVDRVATYRITRASIGRLSAEEPVAPWLDRLAAASSHGVPENVRYAVLDWAGPLRVVRTWLAVAVELPADAPGAALPVENAVPAGEGRWLVDLEDAAELASHWEASGLRVEGDPAEWRSLALARLSYRERHAAQAPRMPWPGPTDDEEPLPFSDEEPAPPPAPASGPGRGQAPRWPAQGRRHVRRMLERAARLGRPARVLTMDGEEHVIVAVALAGERVLGRCAVCDGDVDLTLAEVHSVQVAVHGRLD
jgi:hypothetical protein